MLQVPFISIIFCTKGMLYSIIGGIFFTFIFSVSITKSQTDIYRFDGISKDGWTKLSSCKSTESCDRYGIYGYTMDGYTVIDTKHKILMEFTPKAGCTTAIVAFFKAAGFEYGVEYKGWPHTFRDKYFVIRCGRATPCMYYHPQWFRFKVVRNPFDRVVSSYMYVMKTLFLARFIPRHLRNASFEQFVDLLVSLKPEDLQEFAYRHASLQSQPYERFVYEHRNNTAPIFHEIVSIENSQQALNRIFEKTGIKYDFSFQPKHYQKRKNEVEYYVGNLTWSEVQDKVPTNYGYFFNQETKEKIETIFKWDLLLYNYTYPFDI